MANLGPAIPSCRNGWLRLLRRALSKLLEAAGSVATWLSNVLWPYVANAWERVKSFVIEHKWCIIAIVSLVLAILLAHPIGKGICAILGFTANGIRAGSIAAQVQASYGGFVPKGSIFAVLQSFGAFV